MESLNYSHKNKERKYKNVAETSTLSVRHVIRIWDLMWNEDDAKWSGFWSTKGKWLNPLTHCAHTSNKEGQDNTNFSTK